jgi:CDP-ribitol ribitolphosphotransferase
MYALARRLQPLRPGSVILLTVRADELTDNLLAIDRRLDHQRYDIKHYSFAHRPRSILARIGPNVRFIWAMSRTQYTIVDDFFPLLYSAKLRPGAKLVQVWHALGAFKRVGFSRGGHGGGPALNALAHKNYTDVIVSSDSVRPDFADAFGVPLDRVHACGAPRSDLFFDQAARADITDGLKRELPILRGRRVILFAPTFRGKQRQCAYYPDEFLDLDRIGTALGPDDLLVLRMHPFVRNRPVIPAVWRDRIIDLSDFPEFNHLLLVTDLLVTDYSSAIFDYSLLRRPIVFYVPDLDQYVAERGFYYPFSSYVYGPVVRDLAGLVDALGTTAVDETLLQQFTQQFLNRCDGHATQRCIETIFRDESGMTPELAVN